MSETIGSLAFLDDRIVWVQGSLIPGQIVIDRFVEAELPVSLSPDTISRATSTIQLANQLSYIAKANNLETDGIRVAIPARMGLIKRVWVDETIPEAQRKTFAKNQVAAELLSPLDDYVFYMSDQKQTANGHVELVTVLFRRELQAFFKKIAAESQLHFSRLVLNVFGIEELFREMYGNLLGTSQLINVTATGIESTLITETHFLLSIFYPFSSEGVSEDQFFKAFEMANSDIVKRNELGSSNFGEVTGIFIYGYHFQPEWVNRVKEIAKVPVQVLNFSENTNLQVNPGETDFPAENSFQYLDALGNFFI